MARTKKNEVTETTSKGLPEGVHYVEDDFGVEFKVKVTLLEDMLGTASANPEIYSDFIGSKAPDAKSIEDEIESLGVQEVEEKGMTVFHRDPETGEPIIYDYLVKGFMKNACSVLRTISSTRSSKVTAFKKKIDGAVFVKERRIHINLSGPMGVCQRPLRAATMQGERVALASSESIPAGSIMYFTIHVMDENLLETVFEWMNYGKKNGLGQWHNSGKGRFDWEIITD